MDFIKELILGHLQASACLFIGLILALINKGFLFDFKTGLSTNPKKAQLSKGLIAVSIFFLLLSVVFFGTQKNICDPVLNEAWLGRWDFEVYNCKEGRLYKPSGRMVKENGEYKLEAFLEDNNDPFIKFGQIKMYDTKMTSMLYTASWDRDNVICYMRTDNKSFETVYEKGGKTILIVGTKN